VCAAIVGALALAGLLWLWSQRPRVKRSDWHAPLSRLHRSLVSAGLPAPVDCPAPAPAASWARVLERFEHTPDQQQLAQDIVGRLQHLDALRYAPAQAGIAARRKALIAETQTLVAQWRERRTRPPVAPMRQEPAPTRD
jgi:hypothetical protein